jgi:hypothetical protein
MEQLQEQLIISLTSSSSIRISFHRKAQKQSSRYSHGEDVWSQDKSQHLKS